MSSACRRVSGITSFKRRTLGTIQLENETAPGPCIRPEFRGHARRQLAFELLRVPRPLPAHPGGLEVRRTRRRGQVPGHHTAGGLTAPCHRARPITRVDAREAKDDCDLFDVEGARLERSRLSSGSTTRRAIQRGNQHTWFTRLLWRGSGISAASGEHRDDQASKNLM